MIARSASAATAAVLLAGLGPAAGVAQETHVVGGSGGGPVAVYNLAGRVTIERGSGSEVVVEVVRGGPDAGQLRVETGRIRRAETLRVVYPARRVVASFLESPGRTRVRVRDDGTFSDDNHGDRGTEVTVSGEGSGLEAWADLTIKLPPGNTLDVYLAVGRVTAANIAGDIRIDTHSAPVTAADIAGELDVDVGSGAVAIRRLDGNLRVDTGSGAVVVKGVEGELIDIDTGSGGVSGGGLAAHTIRIDTGSGGIDLSDVAVDRLALDTGSGAVKLTLANAPRDVDVDTGSGGVTLRSPAGLNATVELETGSGTIHTDFPLTVTRFDRDHVVGRVGDGSGRIRIETGSGSIRLLELGG